MDKANVDKDANNTKISNKRNIFTPSKRLSILISKGLEDNLGLK